MRVIIDGLDLGDLGSEFGIDWKLGDRDANWQQKQICAGEEVFHSYSRPKCQPNLPESNQIICLPLFARRSTKAQGASPKRCRRSVSHDSLFNGVARTTGVPANDASLAASTLSLRRSGAGSP